MPSKKKRKQRTVRESDGMFDSIVGLPGKAVDTIKDYFEGVNDRANATTYADAPMGVSAAANALRKRKKKLEELANDS